MKRLNLLLLTLTCVGPTVAAEGEMDSLRANKPLLQEPRPERMPKVENRDLRRGRAYPMQPPTIPHKVDDYQIDLNANKCMSCHARARTLETQAPMISVTHYQDRDGNFLAALSPRRYFCDQCHVPQTRATPPVENEFVDMDTLIGQERQQKQ